MTEAAPEGPLREAPKRDSRETPKRSQPPAVEKPAGSIDLVAEGLFQSVPPVVAALRAALLGPDADSEDEIWDGHVRHLVDAAAGKVVPPSLDEAPEAHETCAPKAQAQAQAHLSSNPSPRETCASWQAGQAQSHLNTWATPPSSSHASAPKTDVLI